MTEGLLVSEPSAVVDEEWDTPADDENPSADDLLDALAGVRIFHAFTRNDLLAIEPIVHRRTYQPQEIIVRQGNPGLGMYIIQSGSARVMLEAPDGQMMRLATLVDGQFFGEMSLLDGAHRAASVVAAERTRAIGFFRSDMMDLLNRNPELGFRIVYNLCQMMNRRLGETLDEFRGMQRRLRSVETETA